MQCQHTPITITTRVPPPPAYVPPHSSSSLPANTCIRPQAVKDLTHMYGLLVLPSNDSAIDASTAGHTHLLSPAQLTGRHQHITHANTRKRSCSRTQHTRRASACVCYTISMCGATGQQQQACAAHPPNFLLHSCNHQQPACALPLCMQAHTHMHTLTTTQAADSTEETKATRTGVEEAA